MNMRELKGKVPFWTISLNWGPSVKKIDRVGEKTFVSIMPFARQERFLPHECHGVFSTPEEAVEVHAALMAGLNKRHRFVFARAHALSLEDSDWGTWRIKATHLTTPQTYAALRALQKRGLVVRAGRNDYGWSISPRGLRLWAVQEAIRALVDDPGPEPEQSRAAADELRAERES